MRKASLISALSAALLALSSCGGELDMLGLFWTRSDTPDARFEQSAAYNAKRGPIEISVPDEDYRVYAFTDFHTESTTRGLDAFVDAYLADTDAAPFCICLGDVIDCTGNYDNFTTRIAPITDRGENSLFITPGNHDIYFGQWEDYAERFHTSSYSFTVSVPSGARDFFLCLDSASGTLGRKQLDWARETLSAASRAGYRHITVFTHTHFFKKDDSQGHTSNYQLEETYELVSLFSETGVELVLTGHDHSREYTRFGGVDYYILDALDDEGESQSWAEIIFGRSGIKLEYTPLY